jgi:hypothetical protein
VSWSKPRYLPTEDQYQSLGARISVAPTSWWSSSVTVGLDRQTFEFAQSQPRLTTPSDTLLQVFNSSLAKTSIAASTSLQGTFGPSWSASLTSGIDHYWLPANNFFAFRASNTTGSITVGPGGFISASRTMTTNSGYFTQAQLGFRDALFLTAALRAESRDSAVAPARVLICTAAGAGDLEAPRVVGSGHSRPQPGSQTRSLVRLKCGAGEP